ncbi:SusC/RagA family TonB-linked outer membrane protein [Chryseobacterium lathyri]|jgi:TonB-linked SusC/RagA family outer membrane protein|uniref:SusC/RagA family TonB-linked outer membrane protein n=1 Tax=Chryseobacterium lathyri TaxID=395933 RepID=A0A511YER0_9FLAO|nr:SusC/RagA family TonB-linked outer membrane protein [Chryseobacterium lathyri]GEN73684.1 SusC/RagA family TonB-linked outer membrane protein [Chryseobacterium lathyri]
MKKNFCSLGYLQLAFGFTLLVSCTAIGQMREISGTVTENNLPVKGVSVFQQGSDTVALTNASGKYIVQVSGENPVLIFRHPDYGERRVSVKEKSILNVSLSLTDKTTSVGEVVLNAGYYKVKERESTGSIARVTAKDIKNQPVNNVLSAIAGRMAGVDIVQNTGTPGGGFDVRIRGRNSLRTYQTTGLDGNSPLYVIDGVPVPSLHEYKSGLSDGVIPYGDTNPLNFMNPDDIVSIEVLKDADATSIYGSRGANGVILVTTKKGSKGKTTAKLTSSWGIGQFANLPKMMSTEEYINMRRLAFSNDGISDYPSYEYDINGTWDSSRSTNWQKYFVGNRAEYSNVQLGVSGGGEHTSFSLAGSHHEETTVFPGNYRYKKNGFNASMEHTSTDRKFKLTFTAYYATQNNVLPPRDFNQVYASLSPNAPDLYNNGVLNWENSTFHNPRAAATRTYISKNENLSANVVLNYKLGSGLSINLNTGYVNNETKEQQIYPKTYYDPAYHIGSERSVLRKASMLNKSWMVEPQLNYEKKQGVHHWTALVGVSFQDQRSENLTLMGRGFPSDELIYNLSSAASVTTENAYQFTYRYQAVYARLNYGLKDRYFINLSGRRDGSSRFGPDRRFANFGAVGMAWLFSKENFLKDRSWLTLGKLRASYGVTGNDQIGDYQFFDTYSSTSGSYNGYTGMLPNRLYSKDFGWEVTRKLEAAMEWSLFKDRLFLSAAWYRNTGSNQLLGITLPATTGFASVLGNMDATVLNTGTEVVVQTSILDTKNWKWSVGFNITFPKDRLLSFPDLENSSYKNYFEIGKSTSLRKLYHYNGIDPVTGLYTFEDFNSDGVINSDDRQITKELRQYWYGGIQNTLQYKNWAFSMLLRLSRQNISNIYASEGYMGLMGNKSRAYLDYWTPENPGAQFQKPSAGYDNEALTANSLFMESDATVSDTFTLRLKNISLSYTVPNDSNKRLSTILFLQGQNMLTLSNYKGINPEFNLAGYVSPLRVISFGISMTY